MCTCWFTSNSSSVANLDQRQLTVKSLRAEFLRSDEFRFRSQDVMSKTVDQTHFSTSPEQLSARAKANMAQNVQNRSYRHLRDRFRPPSLSHDWPQNDNCVRVCLFVPTFQVE
jgi:hypothetical protein